MTKKSKGQHSRSRIIFLVFALIIFGFVVYYFAEIKKDIKLFEKINIYWLLAALLTQLVTYIGGAMVYKSLLRMYKSSTLLSLWHVFQANFVVLFFNQTVPSAQISGNTFLLNFFIKRKIALAHALSVIFVELITCYIAMEVMIIVVIAALFVLHKVRTIFLVILFIGLLVFMIFAVSIMFLGKRKSLGKLFNKLNHIKFIKNFIDKQKKSLSPTVDLAKVGSPVHIILEHKFVISKAVAIQLIMIIADSFTIFALFYGFGDHIAWYYPVIALILSRIVTLLPISPGGLILYESSMTLFLTQLGLPLGISIIVTLLYRALSFWVPLPIGFLLYKKLAS